MSIEVTFRIVPMKSPRSTEVVASLAEVLHGAIGLEAGSPVWESIEPKLLAGVGVRVRISAEQFARFILRRRAAGNEAISRLKWLDAVEGEEG